MKLLPIIALNLFFLISVFSQNDIPRFSQSIVIESGMENLCSVDLFSVTDKNQAVNHIQNFIFFARGILKTEDFSYTIIGGLQVNSDSCNYYILKEEGLDPNSPWLAFYIIVVKGRQIERSVLAASDESEPAASKNIIYTEIFDSYFTISHINFSFDPDENPGMDALESENTQRIMYDFLPEECSFWAYPTD